MSPVEIEKKLVVSRRTCVHQGARKDVSTCRSKSLNGELIERTYDYIIASRSVQEKIRNMEVVEDFESRRHKAVSFVV